MQIKRANYKSPGKAGQRGFEDLECYQLALDIVVNAHEFALAPLSLTIKPLVKNPLPTLRTRNPKSPIY
jgi:hypothetical protein